MKRILYILTCFVLSMMTQQGNAQSLDDQLLIFRNTGETNLLYQSEIDSITFTKVDTLGVEYDSPIAQVFHTADTTLYVSIAEIDSVCFGSRNEIEFYDDVKVLAENPDMQWIIRYDGSSIYYKTNTPSDILPTVGQKLYFTEQTELFPYGLCAKVDNVSRGSAEIKVAVSSIGFNDVFKKFFYAGSLTEINNEVAKAGALRAKDLDESIPFGYTLPLGGTGEMGINGKLEITGKVVANPKLFKPYYNAEIDIIGEIGLNMKAKAEESGGFSLEKDFLRFPLPTIAAVIHPSVDLGLFLDFEAEMSFEYAMRRKATMHISWTRRGNEQVFQKTKPTENGDQVNEAKAQITLDGRLFAGLKTDFNIALVGDIVGAKAKLKIGPEVTGHLSMGLLNDLSKNYDYRAYGEATIDMSTKFVFEGFVSHRSLWIMGDVEETKFCEYHHNFSHKTIDLFPKFFAPRAVASPKKDEVSVAVKSANEIACKVNTGFQLVKKAEEPKPVETVFVKEIGISEPNTVQVVNTDIDVADDINLEDYAIRPVIKYAGYTIPHAVTNIALDPNIQPIIFNVANKKAKVVSGIPIVDNVKVDSTLYNIGPFVRVVTHDKDYHEESPYADPDYSENDDGEGTEYSYVAPDDNILYGEWTGEIEGDNISITFVSDGSCSYKCDDITMPEAQFKINEPQSGCIQITSEDDTIVLEVLSLQQDSMEVKFRNSNHKDIKCMLYKK